MENPAIVIDQGTNIRAGFAEEEEPRCIFPSIVGRPKFMWGCGTENKEVYVGKSAIEKESVLQLNSPYVEGEVVDFDDMEKVWEHTFSDELKTLPEEHPILISSSPKTPDLSKEKYAIIMFESFNVPALYIQNKPQLIMFGGGSANGIVFDSGATMTTISPVLEGKLVKDKCVSFPLGGRDVDDYLVKILNQLNVCLTTKSEQSIAEEIKKQMCCIALDYEEEMQNAKENEYVLPNGDKIQMRGAIFKAGEALFNPSLIGKEDEGIAKRCCDIIHKFNNDDRKTLYGRIVLSGGNTMMNGFYNRFLKEVKQIAPVEMKESIFISAMPHRDNLTWIGGSIFASLSSYKKLFITKDEYMDYGSEYIIKKLKLIY